MKYAISVLLLTMTGCGAHSGSSNLPKPTGACVGGFVNNTPLPTGESGPVVPLSPTTSTLWKLWNASQLNLSAEPIPYLNGSTKPPIPAAATMEPDCQAVVAVPDATPQELADCSGDQKWIGHAVPTGAFCYGFNSVQGVYADKTVYCAESICWASSYEMSNAILCGLNECGDR